MINKGSHSLSAYAMTDTVLIALLCVLVHCSFKVLVNLTSYILPSPKNLHVAFIISIFHVSESGQIANK